MRKYTIRVIKGQENPDDWGRVLVPFAIGGLLIIVEEFRDACIINASPNIVERLIEAYGQVVTIEEKVEGLEEESSY